MLSDNIIRSILKRNRLPCPIDPFFEQLNTTLCIIWPGRADSKDIPNCAPTDAPHWPGLAKVFHYRVLPCTRVRSLFNPDENFAILSSGGDHIPGQPKIGRPCHIPDPSCVVNKRGPFHAPYVVLTECPDSYC